jgi:hypothetical protein
MLMAIGNNSALWKAFHKADMLPVATNMSLGFGQSSQTANLK